MNKKRTAYRAFLCALFLVACLSGHSKRALSVPLQGNQELTYDLDSGQATYRNGTAIIRDFYAEAKIPELINSKMYMSRSVSTSGSTTVITNTSPKLPTMHQIFKSDDKGQLHVTVRLEGDPSLSTNYIAPIVARGKKTLELGIASSNPRALIMPSFQPNTRRWQYPSINSSGMSYSVTTFFDSESRNGFVIGALTHKNWRTGIHFSGKHGSLNNLEVVSGVKSEQDVMDHGKLTGSSISSATILVGVYDDYRDGLESFGKTIAAITPKASRAPSLTHDQPTVLSWKSWGNGSAKTKLTFEELLTVSDRIKENLQSNGFQNDQGKVVVQLAGLFLVQWTEEEHFKFGEHVRANGQIPGWYTSTWLYPFWAKDDMKVTPTSKWTYGDISLKDNNGKPLITKSIFGKPKKGLDPTHPGTLELMEYRLKGYVDRGFEYLRMDFTFFGALEGNFYNPAITTGVQAYNYGMQHIHSVLQGKVHVNLAISPYFPHQYAHSRRISGDTKYAFKTIEYELNALAGGWWLGNGILYDNLDPGDVDFHPTEEQPEIAISQVNAAAITGFSQSSDDWNDDFRLSIAKKYLTNKDVLNVLNKGKSFRPIDINSVDTPNVFYLKEEITDTLYIALFNHTDRDTSLSFDIERILESATPDLELFNLWTKKTTQRPSTGNWTFNLPAYGSKLFKVEAKNEH